MLQQLLANPPKYPSLMYGLGGLMDFSSVPDYNPWEHADFLSARIASNRTLPAGVFAAYSHQLHMIFIRAGIPEDVERCAIAHELVHFEHGDRGKSTREEARADRISTLRLIRPSRIEHLGIEHGNLAEIARELGVTEKVMRLYARMARNGSLPRY